MCAKWLIIIVYRKCWVNFYKASLVCVLIKDLLSSGRYYGLECGGFFVLVFWAVQKCLILPLCDRWALFQLLSIHYVN